MAFYDKNKEYDDQVMMLTDEGKSFTYRQIYGWQDQILDMIPERSLVLELCRNDAECIAVYLGLLRKNCIPCLLDENTDADALKNIIELYRPNAVFLPAGREAEFQPAAYATEKHRTDKCPEEEPRPGRCVEKESKPGRCLDAGDRPGSYTEEELWPDRCPEGESGSDRYPETESNTDGSQKAEVLWRNDIHVLFRLHKEPVKTNPALGLLLSTSGSTGSPKMVRISYHNLQANAESIAEYLQIDEKQRPVTDLPMEYTYGLSVINSHVLKGATLLVTDRTLFDLDFWEFIKKERATSLAGVPYTYKMLKRLHLEKMDLPHLKTLTQAGGRLMPDDQKYYADWTKRNGKRFFVMYGQTEATARISWLPWEKCAEKIGSIGIAIPGGRLELEDDSGNIIKDSCNGYHEAVSKRKNREENGPAVPEGQSHENDSFSEEGNLVYYGENVTLGYAWNAADLLKDDENHGRLVTGDLAKRDCDGYYYITGRKKRFLKVFGKRISLDRLEQLLNTQWKGMEFVCTGQDDRVMVFVENAEDEKSERLTQAIEDFLLQKTGVNSTAFCIRYIDRIPRSPAGKVLYKELQKR